eukprot:Seg1863.4 transcript_id=Seg1863.4/GoldUCD/mRNA.D3Y31 product="ATPase WRNIP1" protein_id=Seg1863.4/GoldUCD/D3Y31
MADTNTIECPVCNCKFASSKINTHVELCLNKVEKCSTRRTAGSSQEEVGAAGPTAELSPASSLSSPPKQNADAATTTVDGVDDVELGHNVPSVKHQQGSSMVSTKGSKKTDASKKQKKTFFTSTRSLSDVLGKRKQGDSLQISPKENTKKQRIDENEPRNRKEPWPKFPKSNGSNLNAESQQNEAKIGVHSKDKIDQGKSNIAGIEPENQTRGKMDSSRKVDLSKGIPLAEQMRPTSFGSYFGQDDVIGENTTLRFILQSEKFPSVILWGPPGCGKTSLVNIIATNCRNSTNKRFVKLSATTSGINDVKEAVKIAKNEAIMFKRETVLFIDEIHRFNKLQQDFFLSHVENGTITLIGATTENPSFQVNNALLSRCKVIPLQKHTIQSIMKILESAVMSTGGIIIDQESSEAKSDIVCVLKNALEALANLCDGDARSALNGLEMALNLQRNSPTKTCIDAKDIASVYQRSHVLYDRNGEEHYNMISALHKSIRGSDDNAALYWLARMLEGGENPLYVARRLVRIASEDIGIADSSSLSKAVAAYQACHFIGMPECDVILAHVAVHLSRAPKSVEIYKAYRAAKDNIRNNKGPLPGVPLHLRNAPTKLMKNLGYGKDYKYNPDFDGPVEQEYLPTELKGVDFFAT